MQILADNHVNGFRTGVHDSAEVVPLDLILLKHERNKIEVDLDHSFFAPDEGINKQFYPALIIFGLVERKDVSGKLHRSDLRQEYIHELIF